MVSQEEFYSEVMALAATMEPRLAKQFIDGVNAIKDDLDIEEIAGFINDGRIDLVFTKVTGDLINRGFSGFSTALTDAYLKSGSLVAKLSTPIKSPVDGRNLAVVFDAVNPKLTGVMNYYKMGKIQQITEDLRESIRASLYQAVQQGVNPIESASLIRSNLGLTASQIKAVQSYRTVLEGRSMEALHRELRDKRFDSVVARAIKQKTALPKEKIDQMVEAYKQKYVTYRAKTIARTESIRILNMANRQIWADMVAEGQINKDNVVKVWLANIDIKTRDAHKELHKKRVLINEPFKSSLGDIMYPGDPGAPAANVVNCRCTVFHRVVVD